MSLLWNYLERGMSMPGNGTWGQRLALWCGRRLALRHKHITLPKSTKVHPDAKLNPRSGSMHFGEHCTIAAGAIVQGNVHMGDHCSIQAYSIVIGSGKRENPTGQIRIGNYVRIAPHVMMIATNHVFADPDRPIHGQGMKDEPITIEDDVWVGGRVTITAGVTIGRGCVIGAGAVVTRDVPPYSIAAGVPARVIGSRKPACLEKGGS